LSRRLNGGHTECFFPFTDIDLSQWLPEGTEVSKMENLHRRTLIRELTAAPLLAKPQLQSPSAFKYGADYSGFGQLGRAISRRTEASFARTRRAGVRLRGRGRRG
jgi:hypothetical protein